MGKIWDFKKYRDNTAIVDEFGNQLTYDQLNAKAQTLADAVGRRCLVFCLCRNEIGSVMGYAAFINNAIVPVLLNSHLEEELLNNLLVTYEPSYLWVPEDQSGQFKGGGNLFTVMKNTLC